MPVAITIKIGIDISPRLTAFPAMFVMVGVAVIAEGAPALAFRALMAITTVPVAERHYVGIPAQEI